MLLKLGAIVCLILLSTVACQTLSEETLPCCYSCSTSRRDQYLYGSEATIFKGMVVRHLRENRPLADFINFLNNQPTNFTTYLYQRLYDIQQRTQEDLAAMDLNISSTQQQERMPYEQLPDDFLVATIIAVNETISQNILSDDETYTLTKKKVIEEIRRMFQNWQNDRYFQSSMPNVTSESRVALSGLMQGEFLLMGPDEHMSVKDSMDDTYQRCYSTRQITNWKCLLLPANRTWTNYKGTKNIYKSWRNISKKAYSTRRSRQALYYTRTLLDQFKRKNKLVNFDRITYSYTKKDPTTIYGKIREETIDYDKFIKPIFHAYTGNDAFKALSEGVLRLIQTLRFDGILVYPNGQIPPRTQEEQAKANAIWAYITTTYLAPFLYYRYGDALVDSLYDSCPVNCSYEPDVCPQ